jgi:hypothetical protein
MTTNEAYQRYLIELQANGITDNLQTTKSRFVINYNKAQNRVIEWLIERKNEDDNRYLQKIKVPNYLLNKIGSTEQENIFGLPKDYFEFMDVRAFGSKGSCKDQEFFTEEEKGENIDVRMADIFANPSFKYRESFYIIASDGIHFFKKNFEFTKVILTYYRYPIQASLQDPNFPDSLLNDVELEFDDKLTNRIITLAAADQSLNAGDPKYQALKQEVLSKI